jgi:hypothetical protein
MNKLNPSLISIIFIDIAAMAFYMHNVVKLIG